jgi:cytosine/creatinine deaminase
LFPSLLFSCSYNFYFGCPARICLPAGKGETVTEIDEFMREAIAEATRGLSGGGIPIGSVLQRDGLLLGRGHNKRVQEGDPTAHGEIDCLRNAGRQKSYKDTVIYSTLMPCHMCAGAIVQFGIPRVIAGEDRTFPSGRKFMEEHGVEVINLDLAECYELLEKFRKLYPQVWNEDIGVL